MNEAVFVGFVGLGLSVTLHIIFTAMTLGAGLIAALYRWIAYKNNDVWAELFARKAFKVLIVSELFSGVWGTIITVFLAGFFTAVTTLATNTLFIPISIAIASIMVRIPAIAISWYTWGKISPRAHSIVMWIMALSGFGIPFGFRAIFAEINHPQAIGYYLQTGANPGWMAYGNPLFWTLYLHTVAAVISTGGFVVASLMALEKDPRGVRVGLTFGFGLLTAQLLFGPLYWHSLGVYSPLLYQAVNSTFLPIFAVKLAAVVALLALGYTALRAAKAGSIAPHVKFLGPLALFVVALGEILNDGARYPNLVIVGDKGLPADLFANFYMDIPMPAVNMILAFLVLSIVVFTTAAFYALYRKFLAEVPETE
ncbi:cytochrome bd quinol oxidase subunit 1 apoprotein [Pyrobaculum islandicum DSM 4184]|uniref:Cytochrome bd quinol oxidase subunit 1 apoprotein n=1 Tax=Pyrobaculum islandicum (strain DSM 4184 / JCM 9189 / GEO3) TaxID=384616 RepID=A1RU83_PYRIL|nr:cytochrome ubiquinol oxidase subunit I [Pyrobaculum islandicum]ABL88515.1 cytochrome bd quinol oxidase subunit 1 apoprotein [Pyrobaculum islandicum DSM 4184]